MESGRLDALSQVVVSLEYYLEALGERRADASGILDFADIQLQQLLSSMPAEAPEPVVAQAAVVDEETTPAAQPAIAPVADDSESAEESAPRLRAVAPVEGVVEAEDESAPESIELEADVIPIESQPAAEAAVPAGKSSLKIEPVDDEPEVLKPGSDPDILEIYLEEASEESQNIARLQQDWLLHPEDENALKNIRRAFHTIKGSGRLVGAMKIGEFAWDFELLLNRLIDKTIPPNPQIIDAVGQAARALPELVVELKTSKPPRAEISYLRGLARALAEFKAEQLMIGHARQQAGEESPHDRITNGDEAEWQAPAASAATQVVPTDKPDDALLEEIEPDTMRVDPAVFEDIRSKTMPDGEQPDGGDDSDFDDTLLAQPPQIPPAGSFHETGETASFSVADFEFDESDTGYTLATDYAQDAEADNEIEIEEIEALELDEGEVAADDEIKIETIGEDFLGDDFGEVAGDEVSIEAAAAEDASVLEAVIADADESEDAFPTLEALEPKDDEPAYTPVDEIDASSVIETGQAEVEEIVMHAPEPDVVGMTLEANQLDSTADAASKQADSPLDARQAETEPVTDSTPATEQETPPDPLAGATRSLVPGEGAEASEPRDQEPPATTGLSFDPELLIIYQQEVEQHLGIVNSALDHAEQIQELIPGEEVYRALHTIHGASRTADIATIGELAGLMEKPLKSAISQRMALDHEIVALYRQGQRAIEAMTDELVATRRLPEIPQDLGISFKALAEDFEEHTVEIPEAEAEPTGEFIDTLTMMNEAVDDEQDNELLTIFIDEANELLEMSDNTLHEWARQKTDDSGAMDYNAVMELQRYLHTLKGGARMAEISEISDLSHEMESMFIAVIDGRVDKNDNLIELLRDCFDQLHRQVVEAQQGSPLSDSSGLVGQLRKLRLDEGDESAAEAAGDIDSEDIDIVSENLPGEPLASADRPSQDVIKVRSDLLDNLVSSAGEVSIYRARMEQQVAGLGSHLGELGQTISRLKGQLRSLEAETDAQIHFSHRTEHGKSEFDPLEMDRYTMIQELSRSLSESVNDLSSLQNMLGEQVKDSETLLLQQSRVNTDLQDGLIKSRMVKFSGLLSRLRRLVRQSSQELGKKAELVITGEENEVDNKVLDRMVAPLEHIIRNALSHGIETPVERVKKGKPETGKIAIEITRDGSEIVLRVSDDGAGVNIEKVRSRAVQLGLLDKSHNISESDLVQYILEPGFSTADHVTQLSGRGVGMDVVDIEVKQLGGTLQIETTPQGTTFIARLPFTLSINQAILVRTGDETYAIPLINIEGITRLDSQSMLEYYRQDAPELEYAGQRFALHNLAKLVDAGVQFRAGGDVDKQPVILSRSGDVRVALHVDEIIGNREIVVKTLGKQLSQVKGLAGASILADGSVVLILDVNGLVRQSAANAVKVVYQADDGRGLRNTVMVVDDSITMRRVASKLLERHNYQVVTAKDGVDALAQLQDVRPDVMLLDIEMPRMDGFELATHMQNEETYSAIPIIMITSRTGEKHRDRALEIGVANYMGKPYQEDELIENIQSALVR
jgi:chemosensory pili system protein ChpA (sensor histidine kinase/response regulator)